MANREEHEVFTSDETFENERGIELSVSDPEIAEFDQAIAEREGDLSGLGEFAQKQIYSGDREAEEKIYKKETHQMKMNDEYDDMAYEKAGTGVKIKRAATKFISLGMLGGKDTIKSNDRGLLDKKKFNQDVQGEKYYLEDEEHEALTNELKAKGLSQEEIEQTRETADKKYEQQADGKIVKTIERNRTEKEIQAAAAALLFADLDRLEKGDGADLISDKQSLEEHNKYKAESVKLMAFMKEPGKTELEQKLFYEEQVKQQEIEEKTSRLEADLNVFRQPFEIRQAEIVYQLESFNDIDQGLMKKENEYRSQIKDFENKIIQASKLKLLGHGEEDMLRDFREQKAQAEVNSQAFKQIRDRVQAKLQVLKKDELDTSRVLEKINGIGKSKQEVTKEKAKKFEDQKKKQAETEKKTNATEAKAGTKTPSPKEDFSVIGEGQSIEGAYKEDELSKKKDLLFHTDGQSIEGDYIETSGDDSPENVPEPEPASDATKKTDATKKAPDAKKEVKPASSPEKFSDALDAKAEKKEEIKVEIRADILVGKILKYFNYSSKHNKNTDAKIELEKCLKKPGEAFVSDRIVEETEITSALTKFLTVMKMDVSERNRKVKNFIKRQKTLEK